MEKIALTGDEAGFQATDLSGRISELTGDNWVLLENTKDGVRHSAPIEEYYKKIQDEKNEYNVFYLGGWYPCEIEKIEKPKKVVEITIAGKAKFTCSRDTSMLVGEVSLSKSRSYDNREIKASNVLKRETFCLYNETPAMVESKYHKAYKVSYNLVHERKAIKDAQTCYRIKVDSPDGHFELANGLVCLGEKI